MKTILAIIAVTASYAAALCPNSCSGHGTCGANDACTCNYNFAGADCSERICAFGLAFADQPLGDLDHSGAVATTKAAQAASSNAEAGLLTKASGAVLTHASNVRVHESFQGFTDHEAHFYAECSGKGDCNRESGECQCFAGYTGSACQRTTCPNDCSGHGRCRTIAEIAKRQMNKREATNAAETVTYEGVSGYNFGTNQVLYSLWDGDKQQACVCDAGYSGADCTLRTCPRGDDPLTSGVRYNNGDTTNDVDVYTITFPAASVATKFEIEYTDAQGRKEFGYTEYINIANGGSSDATAATLKNDFTLALRQIGSLQAATVTATPGATHSLAINFLNVGGTSKDRQLVVKYFPQDTGKATAVASTSLTYANTEAVECSNRGLCDYTSGTCACFSGYSGVACEAQNALAGSSGGSSPSVSAATA